MAKIFPDINRFYSLKTNNEVIPVYTSLSLTTETPLETFEKLFKACPFSFLFHSGRCGSENSRYSFLGTFHEPIIKGSSTGDLLKQLQSVLNNFKSDGIDYLPHFWGGVVGYFGYDTLHFFENISHIAKDDLHIPEVYIGFAKEVIVFDHLENTLKVIVCLERDDDYEYGVERLSKLVSAITSHQLPITSRKLNAKNMKANITKAQFVDMVKRAKEYIREGDIFQANLSQRFEVEFEGNPWEFYKKLNHINPSPFGGYMNFGNMFIVSSSPERLIKVNGRYIETRPIAGTRPRGRDSQNDTALSKELLLNEKERAEHIMLVDLERNDLGRVCKYGTVKVDELMILESYSHVWHIVSKVSGELREDIKFIDILRACFPGGTITGCPKVRCMEIIEELEPVRRGIYTGSMGYIGYNGRVDLNIIIRSALIKRDKGQGTRGEGKIYFHAGAGIVADSDPEREYEETLFKAEAIMKALRLK
ncbi:MAG: aminodeoxychorismate synthase, component I [Nitrospinae bacterium RIFCSPLOWO2_02_39_17]|nr:MAG: aminodeoxychorismate synthase, component I [Nitrospinae bacterium RIFCSPHIGHO2_12_FULL_39_42]OGW06523.1 MAG: aminodeoxychorismate synthase, component I [Nitrospinae bacterium RIFCSPLOWO2_02_39_17]OGW08797.1 MAG: aminodeoxychorismate synthase, component I [Nitrospinae bacterium RIFCSPLOWO2_12_39_15]